MGIEGVRLGLMGGRYPSFLVGEFEPSGVLLRESLPSDDGMRDLSRFTPEHRGKLVDGLLSDLQKWSAPSSALTEAERLRDAEVVAVVTGQQAGFAGGPLYTLYKAIGTIRAAEKLEWENPGMTAVPVFWIEGDDHDFDEVRSVGLMEMSGDLRTLRYDDGEEKRVSIARRQVSAEGVEAFVEVARELLGGTEFSEKTFELLTRAYLVEGESLTDGFARFLYAILGEETRLVLLSSQNPSLKALATDIFQAAALHPEEHHQAVVEQTEVLSAASFPTPIEARPGHLFLQVEGERLPLDPDGEGYRPRGSDLLLSKEEVAGIAAERPEDLSGNVALRPLLQDAILPTVLYLGGPSEVAYQAQLRKLYRAHGMEAPALAPRPFVTILEPKSARVLERSGYAIEKLMAEDFDPAAELVDDAKKEEIVEKVAQGKRVLHDAFQGLAELVGEIDPTLEKTLGAAEKKAAKELENLGGRLRGGLKKRVEVEIRRLEGGRALLLPGGNLQERSLAVLTYLNRYGVKAFRELLEEIEIAPGLMQVIPIVR